MATTERLYRLTVDANQAVRELQKLNQSTQNIDKRFSALSDGFKAFGVALAAGLSFDKLITGMSTALRTMDDMGKSAQKLGVSVETFQTLAYAAELSGLSLETMSTAVGRLSQAMAGFEGSGKKAADALKAMGVNVKGDTSQALAQIADQFRKMPDGVQKTALAMELFGKAGKDMIPFLNQGGDAVRKMAEESERLGATFSAVASEQAERFNDALTKIGYAARGVFTQLMTGMLPALTALAEQFVDNYNKGTLFSSIGRGIGQMLIFVSKYAIVAVEYFKAFGNALGDLVAASMEAAKGNFAIAGQILAMGDKVADVEGRIAARIGDLENRFEGLSTQTTAAARGVNGYTVNLDRNGEAARAAANETKRFQDELNKLQFELAGVNYALQSEGQEWGEVQKWAQAGNYAVRQMFSPEREREIENMVGQLERARTALDNYRLAQDIAAKQEQARVDNNRRILQQNQERATAEANLVKSLKEQARALQDSIDPIAKYETEMAKLEALKPYLPIEVFLKAVKKLDEETAKSFAPLKREMTFLESAGKILDDNFNSFFNNMQNGIAGAKEAFERMAQSMLLQLARLAASKLFDKFFGADTSWGLSNPFTSRAAGGTSRSLAVHTLPQSGVARSAGAVPQQFAGSNQSGVSVNVVNNAGAEIGVESRQNADGSTMIDILVERKVKGMIASGAMDRVMASTFGARRRGFA